MNTMSAVDQVIHKASATPRGRALVVDDDITNRLFLRALLARQGYEVMVADDGVEAIQIYNEQRPDIVFMDVMMPRMDGYQATRQIKSQTNGQFVPVIFLTALTDEAGLAKCIDAGGDDFLSKPYSADILKAKIAAMERIRDLNRRIHSQNEELRVLHYARERDDELAQRVFSAALTASQAVLPGVRHQMRPAATFNGDLLLTGRRPGGGFYVLLGDFTGHGLAAAIGAMPVSDVFRSMTAKGFAPTEILSQINVKLHKLLPADMFMSACMVSIDKQARSVEICNAGMPDVMLVDGVQGRIRERIVSKYLPLGIASVNSATYGFERMSVIDGDRILLVSDGLLETRNHAGDEFGEQQYTHVVEGGTSVTLFERLQAAIQAHGNLVPQDDDISLVEILCQPEDDRETAIQRERGTSEPLSADAQVEWRWSLELRASGLKGTDPVPIAISQLQELPGAQDHTTILYTVLSELYSNALHHGVLRLDSSLKESVDGYECYYRLHDERLAALTEGYVSIDLSLYKTLTGTRLRISMEDSGPGFNPAPYLIQKPENSALYGRGVGLVKTLCESLRYEGCGNRVEAIYAWQE